MIKITGSLLIDLKDALDTICLALKENLRSPVTIKLTINFRK